MSAAGLLPQGYRDRLPPVADALARLERQVLGVAASYGYERVAPPVAEFASGLGMRLKSARLADAVRFVDPVSGETLALPPDITAQVGRIAATRMAHHPRPVRLSYAARVARLRAGQLRPEREMLQIGCELVGHDSVAAACEVAQVAAEALERAGAGALVFDFTLPDCIDVLSAALPVADVAALRDRLDGKDAGALRGDMAAYLPLLDAAGPFDEALARLRRFDTAGLLASRLDGVEAVAQALEGRVRLTLDPTERHGFEYQTWLGFSIFAEGAAGEIGRGGSYLVLGEDGAEEAAIGFSLYGDALADLGLATTERRRLFLPFGTDAATGRRLRGEGWATVAALEPEDSAEAQICTHVWRHDEAVAL